jgi:aryl-alcohol dehydrogenase-like predicted oxidoreductase
MKIMRERLLGRSGIRVSELCLGTMMFDNDMNWRSSAGRSESQRIYELYREAGGNFIDTANLYGRSEEIIGPMIAPDREAIVLATKFTLETDAANPNSGGGSRKSLRASVETSLRRLDTDYIDLLWVHAWDQRTPMEETVRALDDLVAAGKVLAIGVSNTPAWVVSSAITLSQLRGWTPFCALQVEYSLAARTADREMLPMAKAHGLAVTGWAPLARGVLMGIERSHAKPRAVEIGKIVVGIAREMDVPPAQIALAWSLRRGVIPVVGATKAEQLKESLGAADVILTNEAMARLDAASAIELGYPHEFLQIKADRLGPI